jgi:hypothetical protein
MLGGEEVSVKARPAAFLFWLLVALVVLGHLARPSGFHQDALFKQS